MTPVGITTVFILLLPKKIYPCFPPLQEYVNVGTYISLPFDLTTLYFLSLFISKRMPAVKLLLASLMYILETVDSFRLPVSLKMIFAFGWFFRQRMRNTDSPRYVPSRSSNSASFKWGKFGHSKKRYRYIYIRYIYYMYAWIYIII